jgi:hypothetical protein
MSDTSYNVAPSAYRSDSSENTAKPWKNGYLVVGIVAATVSAATVAYVFWARSQRITTADDVQHLLDRCHDQVRTIEQRLGELTELTEAAETVV